MYKIIYETKGVAWIKFSLKIAAEKISKIELGLNVKCLRPKEIGESVNTYVVVPTLVVLYVPR